MENQLLHLSTSHFARITLFKGQESLGSRQVEPENKSKDGHFSSSYSLKSADDTKAHYKSWAQTYDREVGEENSYAQPQRTAEALLKYVDPANTRILDAGCGSGLSGVALAAAGYRNIDGCDFSPEMLEVANAKQVYTKLFEADLNVGQPEISEGTYDAVAAVGVFSFGHVSPNACDDLVRIIKPNGYLIIALNEKFWEEGNLSRKLLEMQNRKALEILSKEYGDHLPGHDVNGWVIVARRLEGS